MMDKVKEYIHARGLVAPGDRVAVAVSGGVDSVALLRILLELRHELGLVLSVAHFNHRIRGGDADADERFVRDLAGEFALEFHSGSGDTPAHAREHKLGPEAAARELRHAWFSQLVREGKAGKIATAHTLDDQAETVLMRFLRGTGARGLAAIASTHREKALIRPFLGVTRPAIEAYLKALGQPWREDLSNRDLRRTRNRIRHELLPLLERVYNPNLRATLGDLAEVARAEEEYWTQEVAGLLARLVRSGKPGRSGRTHQASGHANLAGNAVPPVLALDLAGFRALPLALQRRVLRALGEQLDAGLEFKHIEEMTTFAQRKKPGGALVLPGGLVVRNSFRELHFSRQEPRCDPLEYQYPLEVPGEVAIPELGIAMRAQLVSAGNNVSGYNFALLLDCVLLAPKLTVRNWRAGDRFFPPHARSPKKVKELLQPARLGRALSGEERRSWPVVESAGVIVWMRGFAAPEAFAAKSAQAVLIEEIEI